jgi:hypothetical protein
MRAWRWECCSSRVRVLMQLVCVRGASAAGVHAGAEAAGADHLEKGAGARTPRRAGEGRMLLLLRTRNRCR